jgi:hypothetical protein
MKVTEYRTMLYLPKSLYLESVKMARKRNTSFSGLVREALKDYVAKPENDRLQKALDAAFGIWKDRKDIKDGVDYVNKIRKGWSERARRFGY